MVSNKSKTRQVDLTIVVPVYNEKKTIEDVLRKVFLLSIENYEVIIVNDASKDESLSLIRGVIKSEKPKCKVQILEHGKNRGKGAAIKTALQHSSGLYFVVQDADLEYNPKDIEKILDTAITNKYEVVYGSRFLGDISNMPKPNYYANKIYNILIRKLYNVNVTDMHTCFKMIKTKTMQGFNMRSEGFDYATELISKILKAGIPMNEVPISFNGRTKKEGKKISYKDGIDCVYKIIKYRFSDTI